MIGYTVFPPSEENRIVISSQHGRRVGKGAKGYFTFMSKKEKFPNKKT